MKIILKNKLIDGEFYKGYIIQKYTSLTRNEQLVVGKWDQINNVFKFDNNFELPYVSDINNEIESSFFPIKKINEE
jgi:hypothetical protein